MSTTLTFTTDDSWICPAGVTTLNYVLVIGGGADGEPCTEGEFGQGGAGGAGGGSAYSTNVSVTPSTEYTITIGVEGTFSEFTDNDALSIKASSADNQTPGTGISGDALWTGGAAGNGDYFAGPGTGGGGGSGAWSDADGVAGGDGSGGTPGAGGDRSTPPEHEPGVGGTGGLFEADGDNATGYGSGGGGGGAKEVGTTNGGTGTTGVIVIDYDAPTGKTPWGYCDI